MTRRGAQMVEFALLFPFLIVLVTGVIDVGWYLSTEVALIEAVRAGAWRGSRTLQGESPLAVAVVASTDAWSFGSHRGQGPPLFDASFVGTKPTQLVRVRGTLDSAPLIGLVPVPSAHRAEFLVRMVEQPAVP